MMLRKPDLTMLGSLALYFAARQFGWNFSAYPTGSWYFNPYTWQLLFVFGAWFALGGARESQSVIKSKWLLIAGTLYLLFALVMTMAGRFEAFGEMFPKWLYDAFNPNDKTFLAPYRVLHFVIIAFFVTRFVHKDWKGLEWKIFDPLIKCGQQSLQVFCVGIFLSFVAHFILLLSWGSFWAQLGVSLGGIAILTAVAYYGNWSKKQDKPTAKPMPPKGQAAQPSPAAGS